MEEEILKKIMLHSGVPDNEALLRDLIHDCMEDVRDAINYGEEEPLPDSLCGVVKELVLEKINRDGVQGIQSESLSSGGGTTYLDDIPRDIKRKIYRKRRMRRR